MMRGPGGLDWRMCLLLKCWWLMNITPGIKPVNDRDGKILVARDGWILDTSDCVGSLVATVELSGR